MNNTTNTTTAPAAKMSTLEWLIATEENEFIARDCKAEHAALVAVAACANSVLTAVECGAEPRLTMADLKDALVNLAAIRNQ